MEGYMAEQTLSIADSLAAARAAFLGSPSEAPAAPTGSPVAPVPAATSEPAAPAPEAPVAPKADGSPTPADAAPGATSPDAPATPSTSDPSTAETTAPDAPADPVDSRLLAIARAEQRAREQAKKQRTELEAEKAANKEALERAEKLTKAQQIAQQGDVVAALEALGFSPDDIYSPRAIDSYLGRVKPPTEEEKIERAVERKLAAERAKREEEAQAQSGQRQTEIRTQYIAGAKAALRADVDRYPALVRALATGEVEADEIAEAGAVYHQKTGKVPEFSLVLGFLESELTGSKPTAAPKIEAPKAQPKPPVSTSHAPPAPARKLTVEESLAQAKRELGLSA